MPIEKLVFVYNARSGKLNALLDVGHKIFSPATYPCSLCALTFDTFSENKKWKTFRKETGIVMEFHHIDEFEKHYASKFRARFNYPVVLAEVSGELQLVLSSAKLKELQSVEDLMKEVSSTITIL